MPADVPLPLHSHPDSSDAAWSRDPNERPEPTNFITLWPGDRAPTLKDIVAALQKHVTGTIEIVAEPPIESDANDRRENVAVWAVIVKLPETAEHFAVPLVLWAEPMRDLDKHTRQRVCGNTQIRWCVGMETYLWPPDPASHYIDLLRLLGRAFAESPAILDVNKEGWYTREELNETILPDDCVISESILWFVHALGPDSPPTPQSKTWVYTQGLNRCGMPELEMLAVPFEYAGSAMTLLDSVAMQIVEDGLPDPGERFEVGDQLHVILQPWSIVASHIDDEIPGHLAHRAGHGERELTGFRAAVCGDESSGSQDSKSSWPKAALTTLAIRGETALYKTARAARRQAQIARQSLPEFAAAFASVPVRFRRADDNRQAVFLVKAGVQKPGAKSRHSAADDFEQREHLWLEVDRIHGKGDRVQRIEGTLVHDPYEVKHLHAGDSLTADRGLISDWQVLTQQGVFGPATVGGLTDTLQKLMDQSHGAAGHTS